MTTIEALRSQTERVLEVAQRHGVTSIRVVVQEVPDLKAKVTRLLDSLS